jgi:hypothetical protein
MSDDHVDEIGHEPRQARGLVAWSTLGVVGALAIAGGIYAATNQGGPPSGGGVAALAADTAASSRGVPSASPSSSPNPGKHHGPRVGGPGLMPRGQVLHGESVVQKPGGGTDIIDVQRGKITAVDTAKKTITVTSSDNVAFTYVVDANTRFVDFSLTKPRKATFTDVKVGDTVGVTAVRSGDTRTARSVVDGAKLGWPGGNGPRGPHIPHGPNAPNAPSAPRPSPTASTTGTSA